MSFGTLCYMYSLLLVAVVLPSGVGPIQIEMTTVYPSGDNWKLDASCDYTLTQVYSQNTDPSGFQLILHLESHATGGIVVYWPFDPNKVVSETYNASTEIHLTTLDNVHVSPGDLEAQFTIDFTNDGSDPEENWPRGTCNGPFPIGDLTSPATTIGFYGNTSASSTTTTTTTISTASTASSTTVGIYGNTTASDSTSSNASTASNTTVSFYGNTTTTATPLCNNNNTVICHNCSVSDDCNPLFIFSPAADANACFGECESNESCLGTQYNTMSLACMLFDNQQNECHHLEYTGHESITVHRKSCRSDCQSFTLFDMSNSGLTFDVTESYLSYTTGNSAECLNACIESNNCSGAIYVHEASNNRMCSHFASCDNVDCMVTETDPSPGKKKYLIKCNQASSGTSSGLTIAPAVTASSSVKSSGVISILPVLTPGPVTASSSVTSSEVMLFPAVLMPGPVTGSSSVTSSGVTAVPPVLTPGPVTASSSVTSSGVTAVPPVLTPGPVTASSSVTSSGVTAVPPVLTPGPVTASSSVTSSGITASPAVLTAGPTTEPVCDTKVGCYHCKVTTDCLYIPIGYYSTQQDCYDICQSISDCLGIQYDYSTEQCFYFEDTSYSCYDFEYTAEEKYVYRKSCRTDCPMVEPILLPLGWPYLAALSYDEFTPTSVADCLGNCLDGNSCEGAMYDAEINQCNLFANCSGGCLFHDPSSSSESYQLSCSRECPILDDPWGGYVRLTGTMDGHVATYTCYASLEMVGANQRQCVMGTWQGSEPSCETAPTTTPNNWLPPIGTTAPPTGIPIQSTLLSSVVSSTLGATTVLPSDISTQSTLLSSEPSHSLVASTSALMTSAQSETTAFSTFQTTSVVAIDPSSTISQTSTYTVDSASTVSTPFPVSPSSALSLSMFSTDVSADSQILPSTTIQVPWSTTQSAHTSISQVASTPETSTVNTLVIAPTSTILAARPTSISSSGPVTDFSTFTNSLTASTSVDSFQVSTSQLTSIGATIQQTAGTSLSSQSAVFASSAPYSSSQTTASIAPSTTLSVVSSIGTSLTQSIILATSSSVVTISNNQTTSSSPKPIYLWPCLCSNRSAFAGLTQDEIIEQLVNDVRIDPKETQLALSKKICMTDSRTSSTSVGALAITFIVTFVVFIVILDLIGSVSFPCPCCNQVKT